MYDFGDRLKSKSIHTVTVIEWIPLLSGYETQWNPLYDNDIEASTHWNSYLFSLVVFILTFRQFQKIYYLLYFTTLCVIY